MKIVLSFDELKEVVIFKEKYKRSTSLLTKELMAASGLEENYDLDKEIDRTVDMTLDSFKEACKGFAKVKMNLSGLELEISPEFTVDFIKLYGEALSVSMPPVIAMVRAMSKLTKATEVFVDKYFE